MRSTCLLRESSNRTQPHFTGLRKLERLLILCFQHMPGLARALEAHSGALYLQ